jgi:hypothetical protein
MFDNISQKHHVCIYKRTYKNNHEVGLKRGSLDKNTTPIRDICKILWAYLYIEEGCERMLTAFGRIGTFLF